MEHRWAENRAHSEMIEGYLAGFKDTRDEMENSNRSEAYVHGWLNGRDDRVGKSRASYTTLRAEAERLIEQNA
jgi:hypothetical protein